MILKINRYEINFNLLKKMTNKDGKQVSTQTLNNIIENNHTERGNTLEKLIEASMIAIIEFILRKIKK